MPELNVILKNINKDEELKDDIKNYLLNLINESKEFFYKDENTEAAIFKGNDKHYLIVNAENSLTVYYESNKMAEYYDGKPFANANLKERVYLPKLINFNKENEESIYDEFLKSDSTKSEELKKKFRKMQMRLRQSNPSFTITNSLFGLQEFFETVKIPPVLKNKIEKKSWDFLYENENNINAENLLINIKRLKKCAIANNYNTENKYDYNDLDNRVWIQDDKLCFSSQNFTFVVEEKENNTKIYVSPKDLDVLKEQIDLEELLNKINNNTTDNVKNTVLEVKNNEVVFADHYLFDAMFQNINSSIESLEDEELMEREMLPGEKLLTLDEYVIRSVINYPTLYLKYTYDDSKYRVLDHVFNTIGSGSDDFKRMIVGKPTDFSEIENWFGETKIYEIEKDGIRSITTENTNDEGYEIQKYKESYLVPYPNFNKRYSIVHTSAFNDMDQSWKQGALEFYYYCKDFFQDKERRKAYNYCFEIDNYNPDSANGTNFLLTENNISNHMKSLVSDIKTRFEKMSVAQISKDYEVEFVGDKTKDEDIMKFLEKRWFKEKERIEKFIDETISMIETDLNKTKKIKP